MLDRFAEIEKTVGNSFATLLWAVEKTISMSLRVAKLKFTASECHSARFDPIHSPPRGTTKTVVFRIDTETGNTWKLDAELSKWTLIEGSNPKDPLGIR